MYNFRPMGETHFSGGQIHPGLRKVLVLVLLVGGIAVLISMFWIFQRIDAGLGDDLAEAALALIAALVMGLILLGIRAGLGLDRYARRCRLEHLRVYRSSAQIRQVCSLLGYGGPLPEAQPPEPPDEEILGLLEMPRQRGRPPSYSIDKWKKVVLAWDRRDTLHNPLTLAEFLAEQFGTCADGSPRVSENSFYDWRKKVYAEARKNAEQRQTD